jgi:2'-5' RNA ligase
MVARVQAAMAGPGEPSATARPVRWVRMDGLHVTVRFLGPTPEARLPGVERALVDAAAASAPFRLRLHGGGGFPGPDRPRTLWLRITDGADELAALAGRLDDQLAQQEWPREARLFRAHLTLARSDGVRAGPATLRRLVEEAEALDVAWTADELVLFESVTGGGPARYEVLHRARLGVADLHERR